MTKGKFYFAGDCDELMRNIKTTRVIIKKGYEDLVSRLNKICDGKVFVECEVKALTW